MIDNYLEFLQEDKENLNEDFLRNMYDFLKKVKDKSVMASIKQYKKVKKEMPPTVQSSLSRSEYELGYFWKSLKGMPPVLVGSQIADLAVPGIPVGTLLVGLVYGANKVYINNFSKASKECDKYTNYKNRDQCILRTRVKFMKEKINNLKKGEEFCDRSENKYTCLIKIRDEVEKTEKQIKKLERMIK